MRVSNIPDAEVWAGAQRIVMAPPDNDLTGEIRACEMVAEIHEGTPTYSARCVLDPDDAEILAAGGNVWITFYGVVVPFSVTVAPAAGTPTKETTDV